MRGHLGLSIFILLFQQVTDAKVWTLQRWEKNNGEISHLNCQIGKFFRPKDGDLQKLRVTCAEKLAGQQQRQG